MLRNIFGAIVLFVSSIVMGTFVTIAGLLTAGGAAHRVSIWWAKLTCWVLGISYSLHGASKIKRGISYIVTPNHQSLSDVLPILSTLPLRFRWVIKKELLKVPFLGWGLRHLGAVAVDRSNPVKAAKSLQEAQLKLKEGWSVLIYPEGHTTRNGKMLPFKRGPFLMAIQTGAPILPVTCEGAFKVMPRGNNFVRPGHVKITIGEPIYTEDLTSEDLHTLMEKTRAEIVRYLDPDYDPFDKELARRMKEEASMSA